MEWRADDQNLMYSIQFFAALPPRSAITIPRLGTMARNGRAECCTANANSEPNGDLSDDRVSRPLRIYLSTQDGDHLG